MFHVNVKHIFILQNAHKICPQCFFVERYFRFVERWWSILHHREKRASTQIAVKLTKLYVFHMMVFRQRIRSLFRIVDDTDWNVFSSFFEISVEHFSGAARESRTHIHIHTFIHSWLRCQVSQINNGKFHPRTKKTHTHSRNITKLQDHIQVFRVWRNVLLRAKTWLPLLLLTFIELPGAILVCVRQMNAKVVYVCQNYYLTCQVIYMGVCVCVAVFRHTACGVIVSPLIRCRSAKTSVRRIQLRKRQSLNILLETLYCLSYILNRLNQSVCVCTWVWERMSKCKEMQAHRKRSVWEEKRNPQAKTDSKW